MQVNREVLLCKLESTYNTDPTPSAATDALRPTSIAMSFIDIKNGEQVYIKPTLAKSQTLHGSHLGQLVFEIPLTGPGSAYNNSSVWPEIHTPLKCCGMAATADTTPGSETVTYKPASSSVPSCTFYYYLEDGLRWVFTGCRGDVSFKVDNSGIVMATFTFTGHISAATDQSFPSPTLNTQTPPIAVGIGFTADSFSAVIAGFELAFNNEILKPDSINASDGIGEIRVGPRQLMGNFEAEAELVAAEDYFGNWTANTRFQITMNYIGATQYNKFKFTMPKCSYKDPGGLGNRNGIRTFPLPWEATEDSAYDDELSLVFA